MEEVDKFMGGHEPICMEQGIKHGIIAEPPDPAKRKGSPRHLRESAMDGRRTRL